MKVLVLSSVFPNARQPALGVFVRERARRVARHVDLVVVAPIPWFPLNRLIRGERWSGIPAAERADGLRVYHPRFLCIPRYAKWLDGFLYAACLLPFLIRLRRQFAFELIDAHFAYPDGTAAALLGRVFGCPVVVTLRGSIVRLARYPLHRPQLRAALAAATRIVSVSASLKHVATGLGVAADRVTVIPNGVDAERFYPVDRQHARAALSLPLDRPIVLSVGGLNEGKGHHRIVELLPALLRERPDLLYVIVGAARAGDGYRQRLERAVVRLGLERHVLIAGERPHDEIPRWLGAADLFCLATRSEGWANVLLEALACGRPVVTTRVGGNAEIVANDALGLLVPPGDDPALAAAILHALGRRWDVTAMVTHAARHTWDAAAARVVQEFHRARPARQAEADLAAARAVRLER